MDHRLVRAAASSGRRQGVLYSREPTRPARGGELRCVSTRNPDSAQGSERRIASVRAELLPSLSPCSALPRTDRHLDLSCRISLHRAAGRQVTRGAQAHMSVLERCVLAFLVVAGTAGVPAPPKDPTQAPPPRATRGCGSETDPPPN